MYHNCRATLHINLHIQKWHQSVSWDNLVAQYWECQSLSITLRHGAWIPPSRSGESDPARAESAESGQIMSWRPLKNPISPNKLQFWATQGEDGVRLYCTQRTHTHLYSRHPFFTPGSCSFVLKNTYTEIHTHTLLAPDFCLLEMLVPGVRGDCYWSGDNGCSSLISQSAGLIIPLLLLFRRMQAGSMEEEQNRFPATCTTCPLILGGLDV